MWRAGLLGPGRRRLTPAHRSHRQWKSPSQWLAAISALTRRERQTAELIKSGLSDKEIARRLNISVATTKSHVHNLLGKLNAKRRTEIADYLRG